jgi:hypothetical protein
MNVKEFICYKHDKIIKLASTIEKYNERDFEKVKDALDEIQSIAWDIRTLAEESKTSGEAMEYRLREYYDAIESLGFERKRN